MSKDFNSLHNLIKSIIISLLSYFIFIVGFGVFSDIQKHPLLISIIFSFFLAIKFRDYKISVFEDKIQFFSIYRNKKTFYWTNIDKFEIEEIHPNKLTGIIIVLYVYTKDYKYTFNLNKIDKENFLKQLISICANKHIIISNLIS